MQHNMTKKILFNAFVCILAGNSYAQTEVENLGKQVNSAFAEVRPTISADGKLLYFVVEGNPQNTLFKSDKRAQDIWYAELENGTWGAAKHAAIPLNDQKENAVFWVSPEGNRILIRGSYVNGKYAGRGISICNKSADGGWSKPEKLNIRGYDKMSHDDYSGAFLSNDGKTLLLYFSEEKNSLSNDIYVSRLTENNDWSQPESLGETISTYDYDEISPSLAADNITLYFSSDRPGGQGEHDIWMSKRLDDSWKKWSEPVNMGAIINTKKWDAYFAVDAKGEYGYFASSQNSLGQTDLVRIKLDESQRPKTVALIYGKVYNAKTKEIMSVPLLYDLIPGENNEGNALSSPVDGSYKITLPYGKKYSLRASADNFFPILDTVDLSKVSAYQEIHRDLYMTPIELSKNLDSNGKEIRRDIDSLDADGSEPIEAGQIVSLKNILFDFSKSILRSESFAELNKVVRLLKVNPTMVIELSAHTDKIGGYSANLALSNDRARSAREYLLSKGIEANRIVAKGYGENKPVSTNNTDAGRQLNRRVEFTILKK